MEIPPDSHVRPNPVAASTSKTTTPKIDNTSSGRDIKTAQNQTTNANQSDTSLAADKTVNAIEEASKPQLDDSMAEKMAMYFQNVNRELKFQVDNEGGDPIVIIIDKESGDVIRQVPAQELLDINESLAKYPPVSLSQKV